MPIIDHFGIIAPFYDRVIQFRQPEKLIELAGLPVSGRILDAGGGTGRVAQALTGLAGQVVVADESFHMLELARGKGGLDATGVHGESLPFPDEAFERVLMIDALHHVYDQRKVIQEMWRVLAPGGRVLIEEPDYRTLTGKIVAILEKIAMMRSHFLSPTDILAIFPDKSAQSRIETDGYNAWIIADKPSHQPNRAYISNG